MELTPDSQLKPYFAEHGYVVIDTELDHSLFEDITTSLAPYFGQDREVPERVPFSDYNRIQDAWYINKAATSALSQSSPYNCFWSFIAF